MSRAIANKTLQQLKNALDAEEGISSDAKGGLRVGGGVYPSYRGGAYMAGGYDGGWYPGQPRSQRFLDAARDWKDAIAEARTGLAKEYNVPTTTIFPRQMIVDYARTVFYNGNPPPKKPVDEGTKEWKRILKMTAKNRGQSVRDFKCDRLAYDALRETFMQQYANRFTMAPRAAARGRAAYVRGRKRLSTIQRQRGY